MLHGHLDYGLPALNTQKAALVIIRLIKEKGASGLSVPVAEKEFDRNAKAREAAQQPSPGLLFPNPRRRVIQRLGQQSD